MKSDITRIKVLVVEDDSDWMEKIIECLNEEGYFVFQATDYSSAERIIRSREEKYIDLAVIVLDLQLPDGDGMDLLDFILPRWDRDKTKVVISSATGWVHEDERAKEYDFYSEYITKNLPDFKDSLIKAVHQAVRDREAARSEM